MSSEIPASVPAGTQDSAEGASGAKTSRGLRKTRVGQVVSNSGKKTAVVQTVTRVPHPRFGKIVKQIKKFHAHDEENTAQVGDTVRIAETRPLSKMKRWRVVEILKH